ncbi:Uma2 family endonuclease [Thermosynechococcaceae cyanobacterium BACA0444]|uniref:Uma2 family endonuclease n=1 Tax=Pseudocalidococcus azoricus BACA0444 TaxID=2918990 RepID=A0AAE4FU67_9CYAN|nr:Uma2 family endonuclease [Pseudocalidococcus azoricus]MDS3862413.1 Uma2 family endonuclease [Pseudocalidococcus azoricus BACA0444]
MVGQLEIRPILAEDLAAVMPSAQGLLSDEPEMESSLHYLQLLLLVTSLNWYWQARKDYFIGANLAIYYSREQLRQRDFRGPDLFLVKNVDPWLRPSWVVWEEDGRYPDLILEIFSDSTAAIDRQEKRFLYQNRFRIPEYFWFSPDTQEFMGLRLVNCVYEEIAPNAQGHRWSQELELFLGLHQSRLRYFTANGELILTPEEAAQQFQLELQATQAELEAAQQKQQLLAAKLRALGIDLDRLT